MSYSYLSGIGPCGCQVSPVGLFPMFYADILTLALQPAFQIDSCAAAIASGGNSLAIAMISNVARCKHARNIGHRILNRYNIPFFIHVNNALEQAGIRFMSNSQEQALYRQHAFFTRFHIAQPQTSDSIITQYLGHIRIPDKANLGILES